MRLQSAIVRSYRLHREARLDFDSSITLVGGPNEAGKSTFVEAVHRALFLKAKGNTADHRAMKSSHHPGAPEVELAFESGGVSWLLKKRFGSSGDTSLAAGGRGTLTGEAAETELARVLGVEAGVSGKAALGQWSHLWVWQGQSGEDPTPHATSQKEGLLHRLQTLGGAAAMQSTRDSRVAAAVAASCGEFFSATGKLKAGTPPALAETALAECLVAEEAAKKRADELQESARIFSQAEEDLTRLALELTSLTEQRQTAEERAKKIVTLSGQEAEASRCAAAATAKVTELEDRETKWRELREKLSGLENELAPLDALTRDFVARAESAKLKAEEAGRDFEAAGEAAAAARRLLDFARAAVQEAESAGRLKPVLDRARQVEEAQAGVRELRRGLAELPAVDGAILSGLQKLDSARHGAESALEAMAAEIEVLRAGGALTLSGEEIRAGESRILTDSAELIFGGELKIRIRPGGGAGLTEARERHRLAVRQLAEALARAGVGNLEAAAACAARRTELDARLRALQAILKSLDAERLPSDLESAREAVATSSAEARRRAVACVEAGQVLPDFARAMVENGGGDPSAGRVENLDQAREFLSGCVQAMTTAEAAVGHSKKLRDAALSGSAAAGEALSKHRASLLERQNKLTGLTAQSEYFLTTFGSGEVRAEQLRAAGLEKATCQTAWAALRGALDELQPEQTARTVERLKKSHEALTNQRNRTELEHAMAAKDLKSDGQEDPVAALGVAMARTASAREAALRWQRQAAARRLLHDAFAAEQQALADRFTKPLADAVSGYLECVFGHGTRAVVSLEDNEFTGLKLDRPGHPAGTISFDALSGGTREQTAAAVRLAMAEVLAPGHDGCLPVVFDDAFTHTDAGRLKQLHAMLDLAAGRGLQIIVLTCAPGDYAGLGVGAVSLAKASAGPSEG
ncbi:MAG: hypothetical protein JWL81_374 [Verrucomicrobiales bacterium]|nr:hypothetical protein [Verrucomicrobiales bacterium]